MKGLQGWIIKHTKTLRRSGNISARMWHGSTLRVKLRLIYNIMAWKNKIIRDLYTKKYREQNRELLRERSRVYRENNLIICNLKAKERYKKNPEKKISRYH